MKKYIFTLVVFACAFLNKVTSYAQTGIVNSVVGCWSCIVTPVDGADAHMAEMYNTTDVRLDAARNIYVSDSGLPKVRKVLATTNQIYTVAGTGIAGFSGDGGPATDAQLNNPQNIHVDAANNIYIADAGNNRIRKVNASTGIITTIGGGGISVADGVPATTASITPQSIYVDAAGNIYTSGSNKIRKINGTTGIITTIAGNGTGTNTGDGGLATLAGIAGPFRCIVADAAGNLYIIPNTGDRVRKINISTGIITTVAGGGTCLMEGIPATSAMLGNTYSCAINSNGDIVIADRWRKIIRQVDASTGIIHTIAGGGVSVAEWVTAFTAYMSNYRVYFDAPGGNLYYTNNSGWTRKISYSPADFASLGADSFSVSISKLCAGPEITLTAYHYAPGSVKTWYGDGQADVTLLTDSCAVSTAVMHHNYDFSGTYTIKMVLYDGTLPVDSMHTTYEYVRCTNIPIKFFYDVDSNCKKDNTDPYILIPVLTEVDSNNVPVDTISMTSGMYYNAYGNPGDIYKFRPFNLPASVHVSCPAAGYLSDTIQTTLYDDHFHYLGFSSTTITGIWDVQEFTTVQAGPHEFLAHVIVQNIQPTPTSAVLTMQTSPKYSYTSANPHFTTFSGSTATWNFSGLSSWLYPPIHMTIEMDRGIPVLPFGDTILSTYKIPITGDLNPVDNTIIRDDTVKSGFDPNYIEVSPTGHISSGTKLTYTVEFENTGNDTAFNIHVLDTLSGYLDPSSLRILAASAQMDISINKSGGYNIVKFDFPNVNLLDSSHHDQCTEMFVFSINTLTGIPDGTIIPNHAGIYFDTNPVVMTNEVHNIIGFPASVPTMANNDNLSIYPNPTTDELTIKMDKDAYTSYSITNNLGQVLLEHQITNTQTQISLKTLSAGLYYITLKGDSGSIVKKFVKM